MVLTKKKSFIGNNTNINKSKKINRVSQEGSGFPNSKKINYLKKNLLNYKIRFQKTKNIKKKID